MAQLSLTVGAAILCVLGLAHGVLTLRDMRQPRAFTPTDSAVREAMKTARLALNPRVNLWQAWLGFNLSHSLGVLVFGGALLWLGSRHLDVFRESVVVQSGAVGIAAIYFLLSIRFWYWGPALGTGLALACFITAISLLP